MFVLLITSTALARETFKVEDTAYFIQSSGRRTLLRTRDTWPCPLGSGKSGDLGMTRAHASCFLKWQGQENPLLTRSGEEARGKQISMRCLCTAYVRARVMGAEKSRVTLQVCDAFCGEGV